MARSNGPAQNESTGAPAWVMTFADLMSLLMCFFVLLLSFSELDAEKYKQVAGSMAFAFGVQREVKLKESPKGVTFIAKEFSSGKPEPVIENVLRQKTIEENRRYLEVLAKDGIEAMFKAKAEDDRRKEKQLEEKQRLATEAAKNDGADAAAAPNSSAQAARRQAAMLNIALQDEIDEGLLEIEALDDGVLIRVREQGSFPSGTADMSKQFLPVLDKIAGSIVSTQAKVVVSGHTDNRPISTTRYPSNWALSAARATSVVQAFAVRGYVDEERMEVRALADTDPVQSNTDEAGRARNRRVEIFIGAPSTPETILDSPTVTPSPHTGKAAEKIQNVQDKPA